MVKILLNNNDVNQWIYITECPCNNAFLTRFSFDQTNSITRFTTLAIYNDYYESLYELYEMLFVWFNSDVDVYSGACETEEYLTATTHEVSCK